jgi:hypothetical protein
MLGSDPYLVGREVRFSDLHLAPIVAAFVQVQEGTRAMTKVLDLWSRRLFLALCRRWPQSASVLSMRICVPIMGQACPITVV